MFGRTYSNVCGAELREARGEVHDVVLCTTSLGGGGGGGGGRSDIDFLQSHYKRTG